jgi:hypothetical protein
MPRVLRKLRIDEISACDRGAGEGTRIMLYKRDGRPPNRFEQIFKAKPRRRRRERIEDDGEGEHEPIGSREEKRASASNKHEAPTMSSTERILKNVQHMGEHKYTEIVQKYASANRLPNETPARAFARIFNEDSDEGRAIRRMWQISRRTPLDRVGAGDEGKKVVTDALADESDALDELEQLAVEVRRRDPSLSKARAFAKAFSENPEVAARERLQNRPRA